MIKHSPITQFYDVRTFGQCESEKRGGVRCERSAAVKEKRGGKEYAMCRHHRQPGAFKPWSGL